MLKLFSKRTLQRRVIALAAAYAIALASLIVNFGAASAAGADVGGFSGIICHSASSGTSAPSGDQSNKLCVECCSTGCLMLMAALPPPPADAAVLLLAADEIVHPPAIDISPFVHQAKSHRSRAPPRTA